jgi:signal transduction histidine kinase
VIERNVLAADGTVFPVEASLSHFRYDNQDLWCCFLRDITERRRAEAELHRAKVEAEEASRAKSEFLANMSHELRTPLTGVLGMAELLYEDATTGDQREQIEAILTSGKSLLAIINDLLDLSKVEAGRLELECLPCDLLQLSEEVLGLVAPRISSLAVQLRVEVAPGCITKRLADPVRVRQILLNLVGNAVKFTDQGSVTVCFADGAAAGTVRCAVSDTGIGIAAEQQAGLFQPFAQADTSTTRRFGGTGLGLAIVRRMAERMGGAVGMSSRLGVGSTFWVELPLPLLEPVSAPQVVSPEVAPV